MLHIARKFLKSRCTQIKEVLEISVTALSAPVKQLRGISVIPRSSLGARDLEISAIPSSGVIAVRSVQEGHRLSCNRELF